MTPRDPTPAVPLGAVDEAVLVDYAAAVAAAFDAACARRGACDAHDYRIGPHVVRLRSPDPVVLDTMGAALAHLRCAPAAAADLTIRLWHGAAHDARDRPPAPWRWYAREHAAGVTPALRFNSHGELTEFRSARIYTAFRLSPHKLRLLDTAADAACYWTEDISRIPEYEYCAPLRKILAWWLSTRGDQIVHAAAVGTPAGGVLLAGRSGAGKSTTALACLGTPLRYAGDDCCVITPGDPPRVASLYNSAKLKTTADLARFPALRAAVHNVTRRDDEKAFMFLHRHRPDWLADGFPVRAVLVPQVTGCAAPRLRRASPAAGLAALAPSTLRLFPGLERDATRRMADLVARVPVYRLEVGPDLRGIPAAIAALLEGA